MVHKDSAPIRIERINKFMNQWLNKLERKFGKYAIPDLTRYVVALYCLGAILEMANYVGILKVNVYYQWLCLDMNAIFHGQVWRLFTFLIAPYGFYRNFGFLLSVLFFVISIYLYLLFGRSLEGIWGTFRFNLYFFSGILLNILAALILYLSPFRVSIYYAGMEYIFQTMFLAFAVYHQDMTFLINFIIPIKAKWLAILVGVNLGYQVLRCLIKGLPLIGGSLHMVGMMYISTAAAIVVAVMNFLVFFIASRDYRRIAPKNVHRRVEFKRKVVHARTVRHQCAICGRNSEEFPQLEFRYCSKCDGNYEYCSDHLYTHQHVKKDQ